MAFKEELNQVLAAESEGQKRLEKARREASSQTAEAREKARRLLRQCEKELAEEREQRLRACEEEISRECAEIQSKGEQQIRHIRDRARGHEDKAVKRILSWLWEEA